MSHSHPAQFAYNSLTDKHLAGYFNNTRIRRHLQKAGLITRSGRIVSEKEYRLNIVRKDHHKYVRECLAQAIFHKVLDMERHHQIEIKKQLEDFARRERVQRIKVERARRSDEDFVPYLSPHPPTTPRIGHRIRYGPDVEQSDSSTSPTSPRPNTAPGTMQRPIRLHPLQSNGTMARSPSGLRQKEQHLEIVDEIDPHYCYALDREAIKNWTRANYATGISPYRLPVIPVINNYVTPVPPPPRKRQKNFKGTTNAGARTRRLRPTTAPNGFADVEPKEAPRFQRTAIHSNVLITMIYFGSSLRLSYDRDDLREEVKVYQQHCGGENLCVYKGRLLEGEKFQFISRRHRGFPFSLTFFMNGMQVDRLSSCCEHKYRRGSRLGGKHGHFGFVNVDGASPCYKCIIAMGLDKKPVPPPKRMKQEEKEPEKEVVESSNNEERVEEKVPDGAEKEAMSDDSSGAGDKVSGDVKMEDEPTADARDERSKQEYDDDFEEDEEKLKETGGQKEEGSEISEHNQENSIASLGDDRIDADDGVKSAKLIDKEKEKADGEEDARSSYTDSELEEGRKSCTSSQSPTYSLSSSESDSEREEEKIKEEEQSVSSGGEQTESVNDCVEIEEQANIERDSQALKESNDDKQVEEKLKGENGIEEEIDGTEPITEELVGKDMFALVSIEGTEEKSEKPKEVDSTEKTDSFKDDAHNEEIQVKEELAEMTGTQSESEECINKEKSVCDEQSESGHFSGEECKSVQEKIADAIKKDERCNSEPEPSDSSTEEEDDLLNADPEKLPEQRNDSQREEAITVAQEQGEVARELNLLEEITVVSAVPLSNEHIYSLETIATLEDESLTDHNRISGQEVEDSQTEAILTKATAPGVEETFVKEQEDANMIAAPEEIAKNPEEFISANIEFISISENICLKELEPENEETLPDEPAQIEQQTDREKEVEIEQDIPQCNNGNDTRVESVNTPDQQDQNQNVSSADIDTESLKTEVSRLEDENLVKFTNVLLSQTVTEASTAEIEPENANTLPEPAHIEQQTEEGKEVEAETVVNVRCTPENEVLLASEITMTPSEVVATNMEILASDPDAGEVRDTKCNEDLMITLIKPAVTYSIPNVSTPTEEEPISEPEALMIKNEFMENTDQLVPSSSQDVASENQHVALALLSAVKCENDEKIMSDALISEPETGEKDTGITETNITLQPPINQSYSVSPVEFPSVENKASNVAASIQLKSETNADNPFYFKAINESNAEELQVNESTEKLSEADPPLQLLATDCSGSEEDHSTLEKELIPEEVSQEEQQMACLQIGHEEMSRDDHRITADDLGQIRDEIQNETRAGTPLEELSGIEETELAFGVQDEEVAEENSKCQTREMENSGELQEKIDSELQVTEFISVTEAPVFNDQMGITMISRDSSVKLESDLETQITETDGDIKVEVMKELNKELNKVPEGEIKDEYHSKVKKIEVCSYGIAEQIEADLSHEGKTEGDSKVQMVKTGTGVEAFSADIHAYVLINTDKIETCSEDHVLEHDARIVQEHEIDTDTQGFAFDTESYPSAHEAEVKLERQKAHTLNQIENTEARSENQIEERIELGTNKQAPEGEADPADGEDIPEIKVISLVNTESTKLRSEEQDVATVEVGSELHQHKVEADIEFFEAEIEVSTLYDTDNPEVMLKKQGEAIAEVDMEVQEYKIETNAELFVTEIDLQQLNKVQNTGRRSEEQDEGRAEAETEIYVEVRGTQEEKIQPSLELQAQGNKPQLEAEVVELEVGIEMQAQEVMLSEALVVQADQDISPEIKLSTVDILEIPGSQTEESNSDPEIQTSQTLETQQTDIDAKATPSTAELEIVSEYNVEKMEKDPEAQKSKSAAEPQDGKTMEELQLETMLEVVQGDYAKSDSSSHFPTLHEKASLTGENDELFIPVSIPQGETRIKDANIGVSLEEAPLETVTTKTVESEINCADSTEGQTMVKFISPLIIKELTEQSPMYPKSEVIAELVKLIPLEIGEDACSSSLVVHPTVNKEHPSTLVERNSQEELNNPI